MSDIEQAKARVTAEVDRLGPTLLEASHTIHDDPELGYAEHHAHDLLASILEGEGLKVERGAYRLATGARRVGRLDQDWTVAVLCEYGALTQDRPRLRPQRDRHGGPGRRPGRGCAGR